MIYIILGIAVVIAVIPILSLLSMPSFIKALIGLRKARRLHIDLRRVYIELYSQRADAQTFLFRIKHHIETGGEEPLGSLPIGTRIALEHGQFAQAGASLVKSMIFRSITQKTKSFIRNKIQDHKDRKATEEPKSPQQIESEEAITQAVSRYLQMKADLWHGTRLLCLSGLIVGIAWLIYLNR